VATSDTPLRRPNRIPHSAGIGLRAEHYRALLDSLPRVGWLEVHSENYFGDGGKPLHYLALLREHYPLSMHGVGLSLGSTDPLNSDHLNRLKRAIAMFDPWFVSDHLSWSSVGDHYLNDLVPLPYTEEALTHLCERVDKVQELLGRELLVENVSSYLRYTHSSIPEWEFLAAVSQRTGCGILLDVNNVYVNACNHGFDPAIFVRALPSTAVRELHLAGFTRNRFDGGEILIDTHNRRVSEAVWALYRATLELIGARPTLIEWDTDLPELEVLLDEARTAQRLLDKTREIAA
jgi:uncharacterized protein (UPF0276 family)